MYKYDFAVDIFIIHVCLLMQKFVFNFKKRDLGFKEHQNITPKVIGIISLVSIMMLNS